ncbi:MAG: hypothetical protein HUU49_01800 [Candidatus Buchananbacteria bacterium]|nr:hypothetical protein [Candidatus Buchananbacteria bacterium]
MFLVIFFLRSYEPKTPETFKEKILMIFDEPMTTPEEEMDEEMDGDMDEDMDGDDDESSDEDAEEM